MLRSRARTPRLAPNEYVEKRVREIDARLRLHMYFGCRKIEAAGLLPNDLASNAYMEIARRAVEREAMILKAMGIRTVLPNEGPRVGNWR